MQDTPHSYDDNFEKWWNIHKNNISGAFNKTNEPMAERLLRAILYNAYLEGQNIELKKQVDFLKNKNKGDRHY
jgi:hypothetical protein